MTRIALIIGGFIVGFIGGMLLLDLAWAQAWWCPGHTGGFYCTGK